MEIKYCIPCEEDVIVEDGLEGHAVLVGDFPFDVDFCEGPFASVQPPVNFEQDWDLQMVEPTQEELAIMNCHAEELMQDFEGEYYER